MPPSSKIELSKNRLLAGLPDKEFQKLHPHLQKVSYKVGDVLYLHGDPVRHIFFPVNSSISIITTVENGKGAEVALIGWEGLVGIWAALGAKTNWHEAIVQVPGDCLRIKVEEFRAGLKRSPALLDQLHRYTRYLLVQVSQTAACNRLHRLEQRLARWLLMTHDQAAANEFPETHEFLSRILGTDRSEVTLAAGALRSAGLIHYARGRVKILDRKSLEDASCECYGVIANELSLLNSKEN